MSFEFYNGRQVFAKLSGDLFFFYHLVSVLDDWFFEDSIVYRDPVLRQAWVDLLNAVDAVLAGSSCCFGVCSFEDVVCLFPSEELAGPWEDDHGRQEV